MIDKCPICSNELKQIKPKLLIIMDGNMVFQCIRNEEHRFWRNLREDNNILHLNKNASFTTFESKKDYIL